MAKNIDSIFFDITPKIEELALKCEQNNAIEKELYTKYEVKRSPRPEWKGRACRTYEHFRCVRIKNRRRKVCTV